MKRLAVLVAAAGGAGYFPVGPGTAGSVVGVAIYLAIERWPLAAQAGILLVITLAGIWAADVTARHLGREDPGQVVIDEVAGQLLTLLLLPDSWAGVAAGFLLFRFFDIVKPWPVNRFERLPGGLGIMADDLMAGVYANLALRGLLLALPGFF